MIVECTNNTGNSLPNKIVEQAQGWNKEAKFNLTVGKKYKVYALEILYGYIWYYIEDDDFDGETINYPIHYPAPLFKIINNKLSKYWTLNFEVNNDSVYQIFSFEEWYKEKAFYDLLTDGNDREVQIYNKYKQLMDHELR